MKICSLMNRFDCVLAIASASASLPDLPSSLSVAGSLSSAAAPHFQITNLLPSRLIRLAVSLSQPFLLFFWIQFHAFQLFKFWFLLFAFLFFSFFLFPFDFLQMISYALLWFSGNDFICPPSHTFLPLTFKYLIEISYSLFSSYWFIHPSFPLSHTSQFKIVMIMIVLFSLYLYFGCPKCV